MPVRSTGVKTLHIIPGTTIRSVSEEKPERSAVLQARARMARRKMRKARHAARMRRKRRRGWA